MRNVLVSHRSGTTIMGSADVWVTISAPGHWQTLREGPWLHFAWDWLGMSHVSSFCQQTHGNHISISANIQIFNQNAGFFHKSHFHLLFPIDSWPFNGMITPENGRMGS